MTLLEIAAVCLLVLIAAFLLFALIGAALVYYLVRSDCKTLRDHRRNVSASDEGEV